MVERNAGRGSQLKQYYDDLEDSFIRESFRDFDDFSSFQHMEKLARSANSKNFVLDFNHDEAWCAFDVGSSSLGKLLGSPVQSKSTQ